MSRYALRVDALGKKYRLGETVGYRTLRESISRLARKSLGRRDPDPIETPDTREIWAIRDISFEVAQGEALGIIGGNGAGKSTLLKVLSRITEPTEGQAEIVGRVGCLLEVGTGFHAELTGRENIYLNGAILGMSKREIDAKFDEIVAFSEVERFLDTPVKRYSSGMGVRLGFAVAAHLNPEVLIIDEVLAVGDASFRQKCLSKMADVASSGATILFVSHNLAAVEALCQRTLVLKQGQVVADTETARALDIYVRQSSAAHNPDLRSRTDRYGSGDVRFASIELRNSAGEQIPAARTGQQTQVVVTLETPRPQVSGFWVSLAFLNMRDHFLFKCRSDVVDARLDVGSNNTRVVCTFPRFPLYPGSYRLSLKCKANGGLADKISGAALIEVHAGDYYGSGRSATDPRGGVCVDYSWSAEGVSSPLVEPTHQRNSKP